MSINNGHRAKAQIKRKKKVLQRMRTRELRKSLAIQPVEVTTANLGSTAERGESTSDATS